MSRKPPSKLVVFHEPSERNERELHDTLRLHPMPSLLANVGISVYEPNRSNGAPGRLYPGLAVAAVDLSPDQEDSLRRSDPVKDIVDNERRYAGGSPEAFAAYLKGQRDAFDRALAAFSGALPAPPDPRIAGPSAAAGSWSWCLDLVGIASGYAGSAAGVKVAVLDTGIDLVHPDFTGRLREGVATDPLATAVSFVDMQGVQDGHGHGTHCAGIVGGPNASSSGIRYGVAPDCGLLVGKVLDNSGVGYDSWILDGIAWAASRGARVISMSLGSRRAVDEPYSVAYEQVASVLLADSPGALIVAAAGNSSRRPTYVSPVENPAACPSILAVAALDRSRAVAGFSCGERDAIGTLDLAAPGVDVYSAVRGGGHVEMSGTSMAAPHVAGIAALRWARGQNPTARRVWDELRDGAASLAPRSDFGRGIAIAP